MSPAPAAASAAAPALLRRMVATLFGLRWYVAALLLVLTAKAALTPSFSWLAKSGVGALQAPSATISGVIAAVGLPFVLILGGRYLIEFGEKIASKMTEQRLIIAVQRLYLARRGAVQRQAQDVTLVLFGSEVAKKGFEVIYKDSWRIVSSIVAILFWQMSISPAWVPLLVLSVVPAVLFTWLVGPRIQRASRSVLALNAALAGRTDARRKGDFERSQERLFRSTIWLEVFKWLAERGMDAVLWLSFGLWAGLSLILDLGLLPSDHDVASASAVAVNLALLAVPLSDIGKVYTKWREAMPAVLQVYGGADPNGGGVAGSAAER
ncbi:MAG: hypothetical protein OHK0024_16190 [Thalassobaculales bacterium]